MRADDPKTELLFRGISRVSIGNAYLGYAKQMPRRPMWGEGEPDPQSLRRWEVADLQSKAELAKKRKPKVSPEMKAVVAALDVLLKDVHSLTNANRIIDALRAELLKKRKKWTY